MNLRPVAFVLLITIYVITSNGQIEKAKELLKKYNHEIIYDQHKNKQLKYLIYTNYTPYNEQKFHQAEQAFNTRLKEFRKNASEIDLAGSDETTKRQFKLLLSSLNSNDPYVRENLFLIKRRMERVFQQAHVLYDSNFIKTIKKSQNGTWRMSLAEVMPILNDLHSDPEEKLHVWKGFRDSIGPNVKKDYVEYVRLSNIAARENGYQDAGEFKRSFYEVDNLEEIAEEFWDELRPFYEELHAYVRYRMSKKYKEHFDLTKPMPAHLLGNMWALTWDGIFDEIKPYPDEPGIDISAGLRRKCKTPSCMFNMTEDFFVSIGWPKLPPNFWRKSILENPDDGREVTCHPSAWDMFGELEGEKDVRLIMCSELLHSHFITAHHEVGHLYYAMLYWDQPKEFRDGANPAFHEAVGDTLALSVQIPQHLYNVGLLDNVSSTYENTINYLFKTAAETVAFIPFAYILDKWMWNVYNGNILPHEYNQKWWELRENYQGVRTPIDRDEEGLDPAAKYHVTADYPFIRYFFAVILQFTFHKYSCKATNHTGPLHECSIYNSKEAGKAFGDILKLGRSKPWREQLKQFTGSEKLSADPILEYFAPLRKWLEEQQKMHKYPIGWRTPVPNSSAANKTTRLKMSFSTLLSLVIFSILLSNKHKL